MPTMSDNIGRQQSGKVISGKTLRDLSDRVNRVSRDQREVVLVDEPIVRGAQVAMFRLKSAQPDYWVCREVVQTTSKDSNNVWSSTFTEFAADVKVAKPYILRQTVFLGKTITINGVNLTFGSYGGNTISRTVTKVSDGSTQNQIVIPWPTFEAGDYKGDIIWAVKNVQHGTGVIANLGTANEEWIEWLDLNIDGRMWAKA